MYYLGMFAIGVLVMFVPFIISMINKRSTKGLRVLCFSLCTLNAVLVLFFTFMETPTVLNVGLYMIFILLSMDVGLRKAPKEATV